jgi:Spy/CpxP family protein refolding chaperone
MRKQKVLGLLMAGAMSLSALSAAPALAQPDGHRSHVAHAKAEKKGSHGAMDKMFDRLNLTPEQREKIKSLRQQSQERTKTQRQQLMTKRKELHQLVRSSSSTREQAIAKQRELNVLQDQLAEARLNTWFDMRAVLTPEQLKQFDELKPQKRKR